MASRTFTRGVLGGIGAFGALFALDLKRWSEPVLVSSADGVGTKLKIAAATGIHSTVGADLVNHCVNDILTLGAEPLFFLDYLAMGRMDPDVVEQLVEGMTRACHQAGCALVGGETAELPGHLRAGRIRSRRIHRGRRRAQPHPEKTSAVRAGDLAARAALARPAHQRLLAGAQTGLRIAGLAPDTYVAEISNKIGAELLHAASLLLAHAQKYRRPGLGLRHGAHHRRRHSRQSPARAAARHASRHRAGLLARAADLFLSRPLGKLERDELLRTFNLGVGMILVVPPAHHRAVESELKRRREKFYRIGEIRTADSRKPQVVFSGNLPI